MDSMEEIYLKHGKMIYGFLLTRTQDPDLAEELTQETFYRAVKNIGGILTGIRLQAQREEDIPAGQCQPS